MNGGWSAYTGKERRYGATRLLFKLINVLFDLVVDM